MSKTRRSPDGTYATPGAVKQAGGKLPIYICNGCNREVVWAESQRTGRKYLANISHGYLGQRFYIGANVHKCDLSSVLPIDRDEQDADSYAAYVLAIEVADLAAAGKLDEARALLRR